MPHADYWAVDAMSQSGLKRFRVTPWHFRAPLLPGGPPPKASTPQQFAGTLAHCASLEPAELDRRYVVAPDLNKNSKAWAEFCAANADRVPISLAQKGTALAQAENLRRHPEVARLFTYPGANEVSVFWHDPATGVPCKARPDRACMVPAEGVVLLDVKTAADASFAGFRRAVGNYGYHLQAAFYARGWTAATGEDVLGMVFGAVEAEYPFAVAAFTLLEGVLKAANREIDQLLVAYAECLATDRWPSYPETVQEIEDLPPWVLTT